MTQLEKIDNQSLTMVISSIPQWIKEVKTRKNYTRYSREGMSDLVIASTPVKLDEKSHHEAKEALSKLLRLSSIPLSLDTVRETFKLVNGLVANPLGTEDYNFKVRAIYSVFTDYPDCIFSQATARKLANLNKFFPSGNEIEAVLKQAKNELDSEIENLKSIVGYDVHTKEDQLKEQMELQEKRRKYFQEKEDKERQIRIDRLNAITKPIDDLNQTIKEAVEKYMPANYLQMNGKELIQVFTNQIDRVQDKQIKDILQEKIDALRSREKQIEDLKQLGIISIVNKQRVAV